MCVCFCNMNENNGNHILVVYVSVFLYVWCWNKPAGKQVSHIGYQLRIRVLCLLKQTLCVCFEWRKCVFVCVIRLLHCLIIL